MEQDRGDERAGARLQPTEEQSREENTEPFHLSGHHHVAGGEEKVRHEQTGPPRRAEEPVRPATRIIKPSLEIAAEEEFLRKPHIGHLIKHHASPSRRPGQHNRPAVPPPVIEQIDRDKERQNRHARQKQLRHRHVDRADPLFGGEEIA